MAIGKGTLAALAATAAFALWVAIGLWPPLGAPPPGRSDCVLIHVWSNGFHSDLSFPATLLPPNHPLRRLDPAARYMLVGWGDEAFYLSNGDNLLLGALALLPGGAVTMHVVYGDTPVERFYVGRNVTPLALSRAGAAVLAERLRAALQLDRTGRARVIAPGHGGKRSWFLKARGEFDLFTVCNQWLARQLRAAGANLHTSFLYTGDAVTAALARAPHACPAHQSGSP